MSLRIVTFLICLLAASAQPSSPQLNDNSTTDNVSNPNVTMSLNDTDALIVNFSQAPSAVPTTASTTKSEFCLNTEGWTFGVSIKYTCDDEFVWCSDADAMENCCKCKPSCCGYCKGRNHAQDPHQPCQYEPTLRPTSIHMLSPPNVPEGPPPKKKKLGRLDLGLLIGGFAFIIFFIVGAIMFRINRNQRREILNLRRTMAERRNNPTSARNVDGLASERESRIGSSFFFDTVLPDKSNANAVSLRSLRDVIEASENEDQMNATRNPYKKMAHERVHPSNNDPVRAMGFPFQTFENIWQHRNDHNDHKVHSATYSPPGGSKLTLVNVPYAWNATIQEKRYVSQKLIPAIMSFTRSVWWNGSRTMTVVHCAE